MEEFQEEEKKQLGGMRQPFVYALLGAFFTIAAWWLPASPAGAGCGWAAALSFCAALLIRPGYRAFYAAGLIINILGFYWLCGTIAHFGGFNWVAAASIFALFVACSAVQFIIVVFVYRNLPQGLQSFALSAPLAWLTAEVLAVRIFPWQMAHTQLGFLPIAQIADLGGTLLISFLMLWASAALVLLLQGKRTVRLAYPLLLLIAALLYGVNRLNQFSNPGAPFVKTAMVQGNISLEERTTAEKLRSNTMTYSRLTAPLETDHLLVVWPESAIEEWVYAGIGQRSRDPRLPRFTKKVNLLSGALTYRSRNEIFNSALAIYSDGTVPEPSHKQILMPFGEYTPFGDFLPFLRDINSTVTDFSAGTRLKLFDFEAAGRGADGQAVPAKTAALICYEDMIPGLAREATNDGVTLLVNLTNDIWFGPSFAPLHHNLIASFRAIENRRYLLRATNTGLTAVINPVGETVSQLPLFERGTLLATVSLLSYKTSYTRFVGETPWRILGLCTVLLAFWGKFRRNSRHSFKCDSCN